MARHVLGPLMIRLTHMICFLAASLLVGCGQGSLTSDPGTPPPHGGRLVRLPGNQGFLEIVKTGGAPGKSNKVEKVEFYLLKDMATPFSPAPSSATLTVGKKKTDLRVDGDALVTPGGPAVFGKGDVDGVLSVEVDGKAMNIPLGVR